MMLACVVLCVDMDSAGIGRTGTVIVLDMLMEFVAENGMTQACRCNSSAFLLSQPELHKF